MLAIILILIGIVGWVIQEQLILNWDVSAIIHAAQLMLDGGTYGNDFFIPNPPSILLLYSLPVLLNQWLDINLLLTFRAYIFFINAVSLLMCYRFAKPIFPKQDKIILNTFIIAIAITFFILPMHMLGQRDVLFYTLTLPYLLLMVLRLQNTAINQPYAIIAGALAILGIAFKPQFLILPVIIECYYLFRTKNIRSVLRPEVVIMTVLFLLYAASIIVFYPSYVYDILPFILENYYRCLAYPWLVLLYYPTILFTLLVIPSLILQLKNMLYYDLFIILLIAVGGFLATYFSQRTTFLYHTFPAFFTVFLLLSLYFMSLLKKNLSIVDYIVLGIMGFLITRYFFPFLYITILTILYPKLFFLFCTFLFSILLYTAWPGANWTSLLFKVIIIISLSFLTSYLTQRSDLQSHTTAFTLIMMLALFALFTKKDKRGVTVQVYLAVFIGIAFSPLINFSFNHYYLATAYKHTVLTPLIDYTKKYPAKTSIYVMSYRVNYNYPLIHYTNIESASRFDCLWMVNGLLKYRELHGSIALRNYIKNNHDKQFFINMIAKDIQRHKPDIIIVDVSDHNTYYKISGHIDIVDYFSENDFFRSELKNYRYDAVMPSNSGFKLAIYKRIEGQK